MSNCDNVVVPFAVTVVVAVPVPVVYKSVAEMPKAVDKLDVIPVTYTVSDVLPIVSFPLEKDAVTFLLVKDETKELIVVPLAVPVTLVPLESVIVQFPEAPN